MRSFPTSTAALLIVLTGLHAVGACRQDSGGMGSSVGPIASVVDYDPPDSPEGIAFDRQGVMHIGVRAGSASRIDRIHADGSREVHAVLPDQIPGSAGVLGLAAGPDGMLYAAHASGDPSTRGVYRIDETGRVARVVGSGETTFPNALTFDSRGNLYVTDSFGPASVLAPGGGCAESTRCGMVWRIEPGGACLPWLRDPLFDSDVVEGAPFPVPGPNGIAYFESDDIPPSLYVANTSRSMVVRISLQPDGSPGSVDSYASGAELATLDGITVDANGSVYAVMAASGAEETGAPPVPALSVVHADGAIEALVPFDVDTPFDAATSLSFGSGTWPRKSVFVVNAALYGPLPNNAGPGIVEVPIGVPGFRLR